MNDKKRLNSYEDLPLVLDVADIQRIMGISRASAYELVHTPGFPAFRRGRLIKVSKIAFFEWMAKGSENRTGKRQISVRYHSLTCNTAALSKGAYRGKKT